MRRTAARVLILLCLPLAVATSARGHEDEFGIIAPYNSPPVYVRKVCTPAVCEVSYHVDAPIVDTQSGRFQSAARNQPTTWDQSKFEASGPPGFALLSLSKVQIALDLSSLPQEPGPADFETLPLKASSIAALDSNGDGKDELALVVDRSLEIWEWDTKAGAFKRKKQIPLTPYAASADDGRTEAQAKPVDSVMDGGRRNGDKYEDLVIGLPNAKVGKVAKAGVVLEFHGSKKGLGSQPKKVHTLSTAQERGSQEAVLPVANDRFGAQIYLVDFDNTGPENLIIGCPYCYNKTGAFWAERNDKSFFGQTIAAGNLPGSYFGWAFTDANLNGDAFEDFVVGAPGVDIGAVKNAGYIYGYLGGPAASAAAEAAPTFSAQMAAPLGNLGQSSPLGFGAALRDDVFGAGVVLVGSPCLNLPGKVAAGGIVPVLFATGVGSPITLDGAQAGLASAKGYSDLPNSSSLLNTKAALKGLCDGK
jgi:hypothetical protein